MSDRNRYNSGYDRNSYRGSNGYNRYNSNSYGNDRGYQHRDNYGYGTGRSRSNDDSRYSDAGCRNINGRYEYDRRYEYERRREFERRREADMRRYGENRGRDIGRQNIDRYGDRSRYSESARPFDWNGRKTGKKTNRDNTGKLTDKKKKLIIAVVAILLVLLTVIGIITGGIACILGKIDFMSEEELAIPDNLDSIVLEDEEVTSASDTLDDAQMDQMNANIAQSVVNSDGLRYQEGVTNILVLGVDARSRTLNRSRSDVIIILSINENTQKITMTSIMRDTYVSIPGRGGNDKINAACAYGGPALTVKTVESAFGIDIDHFVVVNFYSFMDIVDALGGVTVEINSGEKKYINRYIAEINAVNGLAKSHGQLTTTGSSVTLTGKQAMGYVRVRYSGNGDYERTERQREVLEQIIQKARQADYGTLLSIVDKVASNVSTDYSMGEITSLAMNAADYLNYDIQQIRLPADGTYWSGIYKGIWILDIDFNANRELLYSTVFDNY